MTPYLFGIHDAGFVPGASSFSPLVLADKLISLAQEADRAGYPESASRLIGLVYSVLDEERHTA